MSTILKIMDLPENERPRERLHRYGAKTLSNSELLAILLRTGSGKENIINLSSRLLMSSGGLNGLLNQGIDELQKFRGIGLAKATQIAALSELSKRFNSYESGEKFIISKPYDAAKLVMGEMQNLNKEVLKLILLNTKNVVLKVLEVSVGSLNSSIVHPREVFCEAISEHSASIIICHNHPSGDPTPSKEDINITKRLMEGGKLLGIELIDHIIIGQGVYVSLKEKGIL